MDNNRFVVLTGHLSKHPLPDLVGLLRQQRKTGRLLIEYPKGPATIFFDNGELIDVRLNELQGLQAICVLLAQPEAAFNFNPLIRSSQRTIEPTLDRVVSELFGHWEEPLQIEGSVSTPVPELSADAKLPPPLPLEARVEPLALPPANVGALRQTSLFVIAAGLIIIGISTVIAVTGSLGRIGSQSPVADEHNKIQIQPEVAGSSSPRTADTSNSGIRNRQKISIESRRANRVESSKGAKATEFQTKSDASSGTNDAAASSEPIRVVMQIENGRVLNAAIENHSPGMANFEALALRIARQRRYPAAKTGAQTVTISVNKPEK